MRPFRPLTLRSLAPIRQRRRTYPLLVQRPRIRPFATSRQRPQQYEDITASGTGAVQVRKRLYNWKRLVLFITYGAGTYVLFHVVLGKLLEGEEWEATDEEEETELDEDGNIVTEEDAEDSIFIPFQFPKALPRQFYKQSDPDWQEFIRVSKDDSRKAAIREELAQRSLRDISKNGQMAKALGSNIHLGQYWLDVKYPDGPPPEYARSGLEIADDYIAWSTQVIPHSHYVQLSHILWPQAIFSAAYNSIFMFSRLKLIKVKDACGVPLSQTDKNLAMIAKIERAKMDMARQQKALENASENSAAEIQRMEQQLRKAAEAEQNGGKARRGSPGSSDSAATTSKSAPTEGRDVQSRSTQSKDGVTISTPTILDTAALYPLRNSTDLSLAWKSFASTLSFAWAKTHLDTMPKGAFFVVGQVEFIGSRGRCKCDINAAYDPRTAKYLFVVCKVKHYWELRQSAKGGP